MNSTTSSQDTTTPRLVNLARLAREIAMDMLPIEDVLRLHQLDDTEWAKIQDDPRFQQTLNSMIQDWNSAASVRQRVQVKAATGFESLLETYITDAMDPSIPLAQRIEVGKLLCRIGELEAQQNGGAGGQVLVQINIGGENPPVNVIAGPAIPPRDREAVDA